MHALKQTLKRTLPRYLIFVYRTVTIIEVDWLIATRGRWRTSVAAYTRVRFQVWLFAARVGAYTLGRDLQSNDDL